MPIDVHVAGQTAPATLGALRASGYRYRPVKDELRENAIRALQDGRPVFPGIVGYDDTVIPELLQAILSKHDVLLLGLRGQAKTRMLRGMIGLLDEWIPVIAAPGVEIADDPLHPTTGAGRAAMREHGDDLPVGWLHRSARFHEKLATPDVTIADLIGEIDLVKHAEGRYLTDEQTMHFGLVPRSNRGLFVMNELPDLAPRIQVGLFNVLEERAVQIRGYPIRLHLDLCLLFSANPEDYTNRGRIVTPLKDRIGSVVRTHYPTDVREAMRITRENAFVERTTRPSPTANGAALSDPRLASQEPPTTTRVEVPAVMHELLETTVRLARTSPHVNHASGVSVRASIAALESVVSAAEMRGLACGEPEVLARPCDAVHLPAAFRGKIELMLAEESSDGIATEDRLIHALFGEAVKDIVGRAMDVDQLAPIADGFAGGLRLELGDRATAASVVRSLGCVDGLADAAAELAERVGLAADEQSLACAGELVLELLYVNHRLSKTTARGGTAYTR